MVNAKGVADVATVLGETYEILNWPSNSSELPRSPSESIVPVDSGLCCQPSGTAELDLLVLVRSRTNIIGTEKWRKRRPKPQPFVNVQFDPMPLLVARRLRLSVSLGSRAAQFDWCFQVVVKRGPTRKLGRCLKTGTTDAMTLRCLRSRGNSRSLPLFE
jgi:hypothetical protein